MRPILLFDSCYVFIQLSLKIKMNVIMKKKHGSHTFDCLEVYLSFVVDVFLGQIKNECSTISSILPKI